LIARLTSHNRNIIAIVATKVVSRIVVVFSTFQSSLRLCESLRSLREISNSNVEFRAKTAKTRKDAKAC
jgi:hypothetical protein